MRKALIFLQLIAFAYGSAYAKRIDRSYINSILQKQPQAKEDTFLANQLIEISLFLSNTNADSGLYYANQCLILSEKHNWKDEIVKSNQAIGINYRQKSNSDSALIFFDIALQLSQNTKNKAYLSSVLNDIGLVYAKQSNYPKALKFYLQALKIDENINNKNGIASDLENIGGIYFKQENDTLALSYFQRSLQIAREVNLEEITAKDLYIIGQIYMFENDSVNSLYCEFQSAKINEELGNDLSLSADYGYIANIYASCHDYKMAFDYYFKALKICNKSKDEFGQAYIYGDIANTYIHIISDSIIKSKKGKISILNKVLKYTDTSISIGIKIHESSSVAIDLETRSKAQVFLGNYKEALKNYMQSVALKDSIFNAENVKQIVQIQDNYNYEKKQDSISAENEKQKILAERKAELDEKQKNNWIYIQDVLVTIGIIGSIIFTFWLRRKKAKNPDRRKKIVINLGLISFLFFFELIYLLIHQYFEHRTHDSPILMILIMAFVAYFLIPVHHEIEKWIKEKFTE